MIAVIFESHHRSSAAASAKDAAHPTSERFKGFVSCRRPWSISSRPMSTRGNGQSRMLETWSKDQAHAPLPASRLDIRACHPAAVAVTESTSSGFPCPAPECRGSRANLPASEAEASVYHTKKFRWTGLTRRVAAMKRCSDLQGRRRGIPPTGLWIFGLQPRYERRSGVTGCGRG